MTRDIINLLFGFSFGFFLMQYFAGDEKSIILVVILSLVLILNLISIVFDHLNKVFNKDLWNSVMVILYGFYMDFIWHRIYSLYSFLEF